MAEYGLALDQGADVPGEEQSIVRADGHVHQSNRPQNVVLVKMAVVVRSRQLLGRTLLSFVGVFRRWLDRVEEAVQNHQSGSIMHRCCAGRVGRAVL